MNRSSATHSHTSYAPTGRAWWSGAFRAPVLGACLVGLLAAPTPVHAGSVRADPGAHPPRPWRGMMISLHADRDEPVYRRGIEQLAHLGADCVGFIVITYQDTIDSIGLSPRPWAPKPATVGRLVDHAHAQGLRVFILPVVEIDKPRPGVEDWRGEIVPPSWERWFEAYRRYLVGLAHLAARHRVDLLAIGSELTSSHAYPRQWARTAAAVRQVYAGQLIYSVNWYRFKTATFWQHVDYMGLSMYFELTDQRQQQPTLCELCAAWRGVQPAILRWQRRHGRPLLITEVGYTSMNGTAQYPWDYNGTRLKGPDGHAPVDLEEQRLCYEALLQSWAPVKELAGMFIFAWEGEGGPTDLSYTPRGKPAEAVLRRWFRGGFGPGRSAGRP